MFETGFWTIGRWRGVPIRLHWTIPLAALVFSRFTFAPGFWLAFVLLVLVHEMGHAWLAHRRHLAVFDIQVHGLGGVCRPAPGSLYDNAIVAWGGVLAQLLILGLPAFLIQLFVPIRSVFLAEMIWAFTTTNLWLAAINLLPIPPLDGALAWKLPGLWADRRRHRKAMKAKRDRKRQAAADAEDAVSAARRLAQDALDQAKKR